MNNHTRGVTFYKYGNQDNYTATSSVDDNGCAHCIDKKTIVIYITELIDRIKEDPECAYLRLYIINYLKEM